MIVRPAVVKKRWLSSAPNRTLEALSRSSSGNANNGTNTRNGANEPGSSAIAKRCPSVATIFRPVSEPMNSEPFRVNRLTSDDTQAMVREINVWSAFTGISAYSPVNVGSSGKDSGLQSVGIVAPATVRRSPECSRVRSPLHRLMAAARLATGTTAVPDSVTSAFRFRMMAHSRSVAVSVTASPSATTLQHASTGMAPLLDAYRLTSVNAGREIFRVNRQLHFGSPVSLYW